MNPNENENNLIFSLDIGTRTIIGMICRRNKSGEIEIIDYAIREHEERNMYDGQIHDIYKVSALVEEIVGELEEKSNITLKRVSVAAAGRALKTERVTTEHKVDPMQPISSFNIETLELDAMQKAQKNINDEDTSMPYYSIGYSIIDYYLDEDRIDNLLGHKGERIGVEILATFLPKIVVDGLNSVINSLGIEITSITLEPIAAMNVGIEKDLRLLNLALVDIGAGTSDIAITKDGQVISYAMTQTAGDELTEAIIKQFLVDFETSERIKKDLGKIETHNIKNIMDREREYTSEEILDEIDDVIREVAVDIADAIYDCNEGKPDAVFLIGGSSQIPRLEEYIAEELDITDDEITIKRLSSIKGLKGLEGIDRPDMITPIGIAYEGLENRYRNFIDIYFNGKEMQVFNTDNIRVSDILVLTEYNPRDLMTKWADDFIYYKNGSKRVIKGKEGTNAEILVNGEEANLQTELFHGDSIEITPSKVETHEGMNIYDLISQDISIENIRVNEKVVDSTYVVQQEDEIEILDEDYLEETSPSEIKTIFLDVNGDAMEIEYEKDKFVFVDIFNHIDFDRSVAKGRLCLKVNGEDTNYFKELEDGDSLEIYWD